MTKTRNGTEHLTPVPGTLVAWLRHDDVQARTDGRVDYLYVDGKLVPGFSQTSPVQTIVNIAHMAKRQHTAAINRLRSLVTQAANDAA